MVTSDYEPAERVSLVDPERPPKELTILCPLCPAAEKRPRLQVTVEQDEVRCPGCKRRFTLASRYVVEARTLLDERRGLRFILVMREPEGHERPRTVPVVRGVQLQADAWVTLVYRGGFVVGIADHTNGRWYTLPFLEEVSPYTTLWHVLLSTCAVLGGIYLWRLARGIHGAASIEPAILVALVVFLLVSLAPLALWLVETWRYEEEEPIDAWWLEEDKHSRG